MNIVAQIFGLLALTIMFFSYQEKSKKKFLFLQIFSNIFYGIQYLCLNAITAVFSNIVSIIKNLVFYKYEKKDENIPIYHLIIFEILIILIGIITFKNIYSLIPFVIATIYTYGTWQKNINITYSIGMFTAMLWIIYNFIVGAYVSVIGSVIELIASLLGLIKQKKYYKKA